MKGRIRGPRLSPEARQDIIRRCQSGEFYSVVAREYGISTDWVSKLVSGARGRSS